MAIVDEVYAKLRGEYDCLADVPKIHWEPPKKPDPPYNAKTPRWPLAPWYEVVNKLLP